MYIVDYCLNSCCQTNTSGRKLRSSTRQCSLSSSTPGAAANAAAESDSLNENLSATTMQCGGAVPEPMTTGGPAHSSAAAVASLLVSFLRDVGPLGALLAIYILCVLLAEFLQHSAAVAMMFPIAVATANQVGSDPRPFVIAVAIACTCCFASPVAYQTHLIVYGAGGYRFRDFIRVGLPLNAICLIVAVTVIPRIWAF